MTFRNVRQLYPEPRNVPEAQPHPFFQFAEIANLIVLGDPGAGKTHLFREAAAETGGRFLSARDFLNIPPSELGDILFIDGLDEKRTGRGDHSTVDSIVQKLFAAQPAKVRISCRIADWLGQTDLAAFKPYFDLHGGVVVLRLEHLSAHEQKVVLAAQGIQPTEIEDFLSQVNRRGLNEFLLNPQNLIMLVEAVKTGTWPDTRLQLFDLSTKLLLSERNPNRSQAGTGTYSAEELRSAAGAICATRLISDVDGIGLGEDASDPPCPSYRTVPVQEKELVLSALARRAFSATSYDQCTDYVHRTSAEYLGASWLASQVREGLPLGRVRALLGVDGHPASELRGLHAWLAVLLPEESVVLIEADPYGVVAYGDAAALTPSSRRQLLEALGRLSESDPWFSRTDARMPTIGALAQADMVDAFRTVLTSPNIGIGVRFVVLEALATGRPLPQLRDELVRVMISEEAAYIERVRALEALERHGEDSQHAIVNAQWLRSGRSEATIQLRSKAISLLYDKHGPDAVANLLLDALESDDELAGGALWSLPDHVPATDVPAILNRFESIDDDLHPNLSRRNLWEVATAFERLLIKFLNETEAEIDANEVLKWLLIRRAFRNFYDRRANDLRAALYRKPQWLRQIVDAFFDSLIVPEHPWLAFSQLQEATEGAIAPDDLLEWIVSQLRFAERGTAKELFIYECAILRCYSIGPAAQAIFSDLYALGETRADLRGVWETCASSTLPTAIHRPVRDLTRNEAPSPSMISQFEVHIDIIRAGKHDGWLIWAAKVYFGLFTDLDRTASPDDRLRSALGESNASAACEGFIATLARQDLPTLDDVARANAEGQHFPSGYILLAGLDEKWKASRNLDQFSDDLLRSGLAVEVVMPTVVEVDGELRRQEHGWRTAVLEERPELARDSYLALARATLSKAKEAEGLNELLQQDALRHLSADVVLGLLHDFPNAPVNSLERLLRSALAQQNIYPELFVLGRRIMSGAVTIDAYRKSTWLGALYFVASEEFKEAIEEDLRLRPSIVWHLRSFSGYERSSTTPAPAMSIKQLEFIARVTARTYPNAPYPQSGWSGDTNPWDASDFFRALTRTLSANLSHDATDALGRLVNDIELLSYRDELRNALAGQRVRRREKEYDQPTWAQTVSALSNGPPANVADLHAILVSHLRDLSEKIALANTDTYKRFWNENQYGRATSPKVEESCRDGLVDLLRSRLLPRGIAVEPEGHMAADRRADIAVSMPGRKVLCELKRDIHPELWDALLNQLDRFYTRDPDAMGYGVYCVFWFGAKRKSPIPAPPNDSPRPNSPIELETMLQDLIPVEKRSRLAVVVLDVSGEF